MADVTLDLQNSNSKELYGQGIRAYVLQDYDTAVRAFSRASEVMAEENGSETHDSLGDVYLYYGKSLLELSRRDSGPLGEGVPRNVEDDSEEEIEEGEEEEDKSEEQKVDKSEEQKEEKSEEPKEEAKANEDKKEEADSSAEKKETEEGDASKTSGDEEANGSTEKKEGEEEDLTDLQVAWEVLELAKTIFTARGSDGRKNLAETLITLGEISLESGNFPSAIEDMNEGLKIQKTLFGEDSRTIAETFYKLGGAYSTNAQIDEAVESFSSSYKYLKNKLSSLEKDEEHKEDNAEEIEELKGLIPEVEEKIADMKNLKTEIAKKMTATAEETAKTNGTSDGASSSASSSSKQVNDISHLVKRKRKEEAAPTEENPAKRPSP